jgi:ABC-type glycerol-3-phosphate transport system permease component
MKTNFLIMRDRISKIVSLTLFCLFAMLFLYPIIWLGDASFRPRVEIFAVPPVYMQKPPIEAFINYSFHSYDLAFFRYDALGSFFMSILITVSGIFLTLFICSVTSYAFAWLEFPGKNAVFILILATMMLPMTTMITPFYRVLRLLGLTNNPLGLIIPYSVSAWGVFLLRQYFIKIPSSFIESAQLDGANNFHILFRIIMPLSKPALAALSIIQFRTIWNDFLLPMIVLRSDIFFTLPIRIAAMDSIHIDRPYDAIVATGFIAALIPVIFFLFFQRQFIEGLTGGLKA